MTPGISSPTRTRAIELLCRAQAHGDLSVEAFEARFALIQEAQTDAAIEAIVADLMDYGDEDAETAGALAPYDSYEPTPTRVLPVVDPDDALRLTAALRSNKRDGRWTVPPHIKCLVILGSLTLDFRHALFASDVVDIEISSFMGEVKILAPLEVEVQNECHGFISDITHKRNKRALHQDRDFLIVVRGDLRLTDLTIKEKEVLPPGAPPKGITGRLKAWWGR